MLSRKIRKKNQVKKRQKNVSKVIRGGSSSSATGRSSSSATGRSSSSATKGTLEILHKSLVNSLMFKTLETELAITENDLKVYNQLWVEVLDGHKDSVELDTHSGEKCKIVVVNSNILVDFSAASGLSSLQIADAVNFVTTPPFETRIEWKGKMHVKESGKYIHKREFFTFLKLVALAQENKPIEITSLTKKTMLPIIGSSTSIK